MVRPKRQWRLAQRELDPSEAQIQATICEWLDLERICYSETDAERSWNKSGSVRFKRRVRQGWPDISLVICGRAIFFETKKRTGVLSEKQAECHAVIRRAGGLVYVVRSLEDAQAAVREVRMGETK